MDGVCGCGDFILGRGLVERGRWIGRRVGYGIWYRWVRFRFWVMDFY